VSSVALDTSVVMRLLSGIPEAQAKVDAAKQKVADLDKKLKELTGESVPEVKTPVISETVSSSAADKWSQVSTAEEAKNSLKQFGIGGTISGEIDDQVIKYANNIGDELTTIRKYNPELFEKLEGKLDTLSIKIKDLDVFIGDDGQSFGIFRPPTNEIFLPRNRA